MTDQDIAQAPIAPRLRWLRVDFHLWPREQINLSPHTGATLRGFLKKPMRDLLCVTGLPQCAHCPTLDRCGYGLMWEKPPAKALPDVHRPLAALLPLPLSGHKRTFSRGQALVLRYILLGLGTELVPHLIRGMQAACENGLGRGVGRAAVRHVQVYERRDGGAKTVFDHEQGFLPYPIHPTTLEAPLAPSPGQAHEVLLQLHTPLHLRQPGSKQMAQRIDPLLLTRSLTRRMHHLASQLEGVVSYQWFQPYLEMARQVRVAHEKTQVVRWHRWSNLQNKNVPMRGLEGQASLKGVPTPLWELWAWLPHVFVGKGTRHGQGYLEPSLLDEPPTTSL